ncbi:MAG TPA: hypothetical protein VGK93_05335 [Candidatus Eisenbacteria bacterium]
MTQLVRSRLVAGLLCLVFVVQSVPLPVGADPASPTPDATAPAGGGPDRTMAPDTTAGSRPAEAPAGPGAPPGNGETPAALEQAREYIKNGDYDNAIELLKGVLEKARSRMQTLREAYLLLIKTYVFLGNDLRSKPQGREASNLNYQEARKLIAECLRTKELRHARPEPASEYPPEMITFFAEVRSQLFGSFRVVELEPREAVVLLDADTLRALPGDGLFGDVDLAIGPHLVVVRAKGYKNVTEEVTISPNSTLERPYRLARRHGSAWYATVASGTLGVVGGVIALAAGRGSTSGPATPEPLPGAPPPPAKR